MPRLVLLTDDHRLPDPLPLLPRLPRGSWVILRHADANSRASWARPLARACRRHGLTPLVAGDFALAVVLHCGLHLSEAMARRAPPKVRLWRRRGGGPLTAATHGYGALARAARIQSDAALLSPVFPTASHPGAPTLGPLRFRQWALRAALPVFALGGVTARTIGRLSGSNAVGVATVGGLGTPQP